MAKFNSGDILKILRKFNLANEDNVPRNIEELKRYNLINFLKFLALNLTIINFLLLMTVQQKMMNNIY